MNRCRFGLWITALSIVWGAAAQGAPADPVASGNGLLTRLLQERAAGFSVEALPQESGRDVFEIESANGKVVLRGSSGVAVASALQWYLTQYAHANTSLYGTQLNLPDPLPPVPEKVRIATPLQYRYCFNYCCFSYSMAWWDWAQWERAIDWMALHGINMPLAVTGQESVWQAVCRQFGLTQEETDRFLVGAAFLPFGWMGCIDGWGGPLSQSWIDQHRELGQRILARERELGMTPVLQGFTGHAPEAMKRVFPKNRFQQLPSWCAFPGTTFVDPGDELFQRVGKAFIEEQRRQFGTDHFYASDTFIEMSPPSDDPAFLENMGRAVYNAMAGGDPHAVWLMQGWLFFNNPKFWKPEQSKALLRAAPENRMIVLDLFCESNPTWTITESFYGRPWVWCIIQSFGNQVSLHGGLKQIAEGLPKAVADPKANRLSGAGFIMEGFGYNPVVYDLMSELMWRPQTPDLPSWIDGYAQARYGRVHEKAQAAWRTLLNTAYSKPNQESSPICRRPSLAELKRKNTASAEVTAQLYQAAQDLAACGGELGGTDTLRYDLAHVTRQVLANLAGFRHADMAAALQKKDMTAFDSSSQAFLTLIREMDELLATREEFLLGRWLEDAKRWAVNEDDKRRLEWNARTQITLWGAKDGVLPDYAAKQWAGLLTGFYLPRWQQFIGAVKEAAQKGVEVNEQAFLEQIRDWEDTWTHGTENYPAVAQGDTVDIARRLLAGHGQDIVSLAAKPE